MVPYLGLVILLLVIRVVIAVQEAPTIREDFRQQARAEGYAARSLGGSGEPTQSVRRHRALLQHRRPAGT